MQFAGLSLRWRGWVAAAVGLATVLALPARAGAEEPGPAADVVPGEVLISAPAGTSAAAVARKLGVRVVEQVPGRPDVVVVASRPGGEAALAAKLDDAKGVLTAMPNLRVHAMAAPNDPGFTYQWHLGASSTWPGAANWLPAWQARTSGDQLVDGSGVTVAVLDTGVSQSPGTPELAHLATGFDFVDADTDASDEEGHGTHVAGTIAQATGNGIGEAGVASGATVLPVRVLDENGSGEFADILAGMAWATTHGADVINMSLGGQIDDPIWATMICDAVDQAVIGGALVVASAGNDSGAVGYPAHCSGAIAVSATAPDGSRTDYSNYGPEIDLAAPGGSFTDLTGDGRWDSVVQRTFAVSGGVKHWGDYGYQGTSMAAPHVSGAAALLAQLDPTATPAQLRARLTGSAHDLGPAGQDTTYGAGVLDIAAAVRAAGATMPAPSVRVSGPSWAYLRTNIRLRAYVTTASATGLHWSVNRAGCTLSTPAASATWLSCPGAAGTVTVTVGATDADAHAGQASLHVSLRTKPPVVRTKAPARIRHGAYAVVRAGVTLDTTRLRSFTWTDSRGDCRVVRAHAQSTRLICARRGTVRLTAKATDSAGRTGSASVLVRVV